MLPAPWTGAGNPLAQSHAHSTEPGARGSARHGAGAPVASRWLRSGRGECPRERKPGGGAKKRADGKKPRKKGEPPLRNPVREAQAQRRFDRAESLIKRLVRDNFRELERAFKLGDADGSGSLDATELRNVLFRFDIVLEDEHYAQLLQVSTPRPSSLGCVFRFSRRCPRPLPDVFSRWAAFSHQSPAVFRRRTLTRMATARSPTRSSSASLPRGAPRTSSSS